MSRESVLSLIASLFQGGSPIIHANIVAAMQQRGVQRHDVLSFISRVRRGHTVQHIKDSMPHGILTEVQVGLLWLDRAPSNPLPTSFAHVGIWVRPALLASWRPWPVDSYR